MGRNAYFELIEQNEKMYLLVHPAEGDGEMFQVDEVIRYLDFISFPDYDGAKLATYLDRGAFGEPFELWPEKIIPVGGKCIVSVARDGMKALARFYPPSSGGDIMTEDEIIADLRIAGVKHGVRKKAIDHFLENHEYCRDYLLAVATKPREGHDAKITYHFDINQTARPKMNEDGSVDFHQLGNIKPVEAGQKLATLKPVDWGTPGVTVTGKPLKPRKVRNRHLRFGRNIRISEDKLKIYSQVSGHVSLVEDMVMVSDIYQVPANVDASTGDIEYKGTVQVTGNVNTGYKIVADGDIVVNGVVEGAELVSGGNIVLKRGMQGGEKGSLTAEGNITAKFIESATIKCKGMLKADAVLNSNVECREDVEVRGKKGLINGGSIRTYGTISATTIGSEMGSNTAIEVISDKELIIRVNQLHDRNTEIEAELKKIEEVTSGIRAMVSRGEEVSEEQKGFVKRAAKSKPALQKELKENRYERESILERIDNNKRSCVKVYDAVYAGTELNVKDASRIIHDPISHCRFVRDGADVRMTDL
ncbi:MAG: FapA family protein [Eubacterium sp.]|nr:FapA family protein [Eubacterium sp.]